MKKIFALVAMMFICHASFSQIHVKENSFRKIDGYVMLDKQNHTDMNNSPMALIKISTENIKAEERARFEFKGNLATFFDVQLMTGEIYLYISTTATFIEIIHPDYGKTEYWLPETLCDFCGYEMVVVGDFKSDEKEVAKVLSNYLIIKTDQANAMIYIDDEFVDKNNINEPLTIGNTYKWRVECPLYHARSGEVTITEGAPISIEVKMRPAYGFLKVNSNPEKADVYVEDKLVGTTPYASKEMQSGTYQIEIRKKGYPVKKQEVTITDGMTTELDIDMSDAAAAFATLNYGFSTAPQHSLGLTFGMVKKFGWYFSAMTGLSFDAFNTVATCDELGNVDGETQIYSGNTANSRLSFIAGAMFRPVNILALKLGAGYGTRTLAWETADGSYIANEAYSVSGVDINAGVQLFLNKLSLSIDCVTTNAKYSEIKIGVGVVF